MKNALFLTLPFPPSLNRIYRAVNGRLILSKPARDWTLAAKNVLPMGIAEPLTGRLQVQIELVPPRSYGKRRWDIANREKIVCDLLTQQRVWLDDSQIDELFIYRAIGEVTENGEARIVVYEMESSETATE